MGVDELGVDEMGVDEIGRRRSGTTAFETVKLRLSIFTVFTDQISLSPIRCQLAKSNWKMIEKC